MLVEERKKREEERKTGIEKISSGRSRDFSTERQREREKKRHAQNSDQRDARDDVNVFSGNGQNHQKRAASGDNSSNLQSISTR